jgi:hypothetical protein
VHSFVKDYLPADVSSSSAYAQVSSLLAQFVANPSAWLTALIAVRVAIAVVRFLLRMVFYRPVVVGGPRRYYVRR